MQQTLSEQIRHEADIAMNRGITRYRIGVDCRIHPHRVAMFIAGKQNLSQEGLDRIASRLGLRIVRMESDAVHS